MLVVACSLSLRSRIRQLNHGLVYGDAEDMPPRLQTLVFAVLLLPPSLTLGLIQAGVAQLGLAGVPTAFVPLLSLQ